MAKQRRYSSDQSALKNAAKTLLANIRFASVDEPIKTIVVTSSVPAEGKSTVSLNLAQAMASSGKRVLLVECDMRKRSLANYMAVHAQWGLYSVLSEQVTLDVAAVETAYPYLSFLDAEPSIPNPADILSSRRFAKFVETCGEKYDFVVFDAPPVCTFIDAAILSSMVDGTLFVIRENFTKRSDVTAAFEQLKKADAHVIGTVLNYCEGSDHSSSYYYGYYARSDNPQGSVSDSPKVSFSRSSRPAQGKRFK